MCSNGSRCVDVGGGVQPPGCVPSSVLAGPLSVCSSIGLAKSSLESINGVNLFGEQGTSSSVIYVDIDAHNRNRTIFESILPRESNSKVCWHDDLMLHCCMSARRVPCVSVCSSRLSSRYSSWRHLISCQ